MLSTRVCAPSLSKRPTAHILLLLNPSLPRSLSFHHTPLLRPPSLSFAPLASPPFLPLAPFALPLRASVSPFPEPRVPHHQARSRNGLLSHRIAYHTFPLPPSFVRAILSVLIALVAAFCGLGYPKRTYSHLAGSSNPAAAQSIASKQTNPHSLLFDCCLKLEVSSRGKDLRGNWLENTGLAGEVTDSVTEAEKHLCLHELDAFIQEVENRCEAPDANDSENRIKSNAFVKIAAAKVGPAVVRLDTERTAATDDSNHSVLAQWFGVSAINGPRKPIRERGLGSGFVIDGKQGLVATNAHVVKDADFTKVTLIDGRSFEGQIIGLDEITDLALLKVMINVGEVLPQATLGNSQTVELGDWVIAVGNPFGLNNTISLGIISNLHRTAVEVGIPGKNVELFQTDCAINPGNSGGPLVNEFGEVIGINTAIRADAEGIAFAIPINSVKHIIEALAKDLRSSIHV